MIFRMLSRTGVTIVSLVEAEVCALEAGDGRASGPLFECNCRAPFPSGRDAAHDALAILPGALRQTNEAATRLPFWREHPASRGATSNLPGVAIPRYCRGAIATVDVALYAR